MSAQQEADAILAGLSSADRMPGGWNCIKHGTPLHVFEGVHFYCFECRAIPHEVSSPTGNGYTFPHPLADGQHTVYFSHE